MAERKKGAGGRRDKEGYKQLNLNLSPELIKKIRLCAVEKDMNLSEMAEIMFAYWFENHD